MVEIAQRKNNNKTRYDLIPPIVLEAIAKVCMAGIEKRGYPERNWEKGMPFSWSYRSLVSHLQNWWQGKEIDDGPEGTDLPHSYLILWNAMAIIEMERRLGEGDPRLSRLTIDDRPYLKGATTLDEILSSLPKERQQIIEDKANSLINSEENRNLENVASEDEDEAFREIHRSTLSHLFDCSKDWP